MILEFTLYLDSMPDETIPVFISSAHIVSIDIKKLHYINEDGEKEMQYTRINLQDGRSYDVKENAEWATSLINTMG